MTSAGDLPQPLPPPELLEDDVVELRLIRVVAAGDTSARAPEAAFVGEAPELRFAIHRRSDGTRVGRIHLRLTSLASIVDAVGHCGYEVEEAHRRNGYATRALRLIRGVARHYGVAPLLVFIEPPNTASRRAAERAGLALVDTIDTMPAALALGLGPQMCRYMDP